MQVKITFMDGSADITTSTTQTMSDILSSLNNDRYVNIGTTIVMSGRVNTVEEVSA
jgi:hypothetical protein